MPDQNAKPPATSHEFHYVISSLKVLSDVELRAATPSRRTFLPEIVMKRGEVPHDSGLPATEFFRLEIEGVGSFSVRQGREILYDPLPGVTATDLAIYLIGTCFAALLQQRGSTVLHGSAVSVYGRAMLFCGDSGAGKSTLAAILSGYGYPLLNDDVCNLIRDDNGTVRVTPDGRMLKLWAKTLDFLQQEPIGPPIRQGFDKFYISPQLGEEREQPVGGIYILKVSAADKAPSLLRLDTPAAMLAISGVTYRRELVEAMGQQQAYFTAAVALCRQCPVYELYRPNNLKLISEVLALLTRSWKTPAAATERSVG